MVVGETTFEDVPNTDPTELSMERAVGVPPLRVQARVVELPKLIVVGVAVNVEIIGAGGFTVTVTVFVTVPLTFVAVMV